MTKRLDNLATEVKHDGISILDSGTANYTPQAKDDIIPVNTFGHSRVNKSSLPDLEFDIPREETVFEITPDGDNVKDIRYNLSADRPAVNEKLIFDVKADAKGEVILNYEDDGKGEYKRHTEIEIRAEANANFTLFLVQRLSEMSDSRAFVQVHCLPRSDVRVVVADSGAQTHRLDLRADLEERSLFDCQSIYFGRADEKYDYNYNLVHHGVLSQSNLLVNGALKDNARKVFRGTIDFRRGSSGSTGSESEYVTMLDDTVHNLAIPLLLCTEDNVIGNHAASAGRLDPAMVFYVMSRGFSQREAEKLIIASRFSHVLDLLPNSTLKDAVLGDILQKLDEA